MENKVVNISVRNLVEFILRSGDIDSRYMGSKRAVEGIKVHQKIQRKRKKEALLNNQVYDSEVFLKFRYTYKDFDFVVEGRADGVLRNEDDSKKILPKEILIEEIKSTVRPVDEIENNSESWHWAQAKCYGLMYCTQNELENISIQLTYSNVETEEEICFANQFTKDELENFFLNLIEKYYKFATLEHERSVSRNASVQKLEFPYENYRRSQREFAVAVYRTIQHEKKIFAQAPTGTGKTISTLFPAIKAVGLGMSSKIFYLTAKTITRQVAEDAMKVMAGRGLCMHNVTLTAKDKICFCKEGGCNPVDCKFAHGHFDRINDAIIDIISSEHQISRDVIEIYAIKHTVCPFEFSFDIALFCDVIICDYNYVYDPKVHLKRFFDERAKNDYIILNDEAHNLVERAREMFSAELNKSSFATARKYFKTKNKALYKSIGEINSWLKKVCKNFLPEQKTVILDEVPSEFLLLLTDFCYKADTWLAENHDEAGQEVKEFLDLYFNVLDFNRVNEFFDTRYVFLLTEEKTEVTVKLLCLDPSYLLSLVHKKVKSSIFFTATFTPLKYFRNVLGGNDDDYFLQIASPFSKDNFCLLVNDSISTKYKDRESSFDKIAEQLYCMIVSKRGNYLAFFSSYEYLKSVFLIFTEKYPEVDVLVQNQNMSEFEREDFLNRFAPDNEKTLLGLVVLGGIFSEGIDLVGTRLIGVAIIGVGLPLITHERNIIADYYKHNKIEKTEQDYGDFYSNSDVGFDYAYVFPGMNKVMQAAGRVIRSHTDKGIVLLIDSRFSTSKYKNLFPEEWSHGIIVRDRKNLAERLEYFWSNL